MIRKLILLACSMMLLAGCSSHFITDSDFRDKVSEDFASRSHIMEAAGIDLSEMTLRTDEEGITICCPPHVDFSQKAVQELLRNAIIRALKKSAQTYLPPLLDELAEHYGFKYKRVKITGSKSRWGSCSAIGSINLSCYLMLLPPHLMDYVLLHELTHTKEMNHGPKFWEILDDLTEGRAKSLRAELKNFRTSF